MAEKREEQIFEETLTARNLKHSQQRKEILEIFLTTDRHLTADELYRMTKRKYPALGYATVYRTLKLLCECGLSRELKFEDGATRYEHFHGHIHHDHLICTRCGRLVEVVDSDIERLQDKLFKIHGFYPQRHRMELYGICRRCKK